MTDLLLTLLLLAAPQPRHDAAWVSIPSADSAAPSYELPYQDDLLIYDDFNLGSVSDARTAMTKPHRSYANMKMAWGAGADYEVLATGNRVGVTGDAWAYIDAGTGGAGYFDITNSNDSAGSVWVYHTNAVLEGRDYFSIGNDMLFFQHATILTYYLGWDQSFYNMDPRPELSAHTWHHLMYVYDQSATTIRFYEDGELIKTANNGADAVWPYTFIFMAQLTSGARHAKGGKIDKFAHWEGIDVTAGELDDDDVAAIYNGQKADFGL